ncbi:ribonuclease H-like domain-containing protein [Tanacetum coccineum]
MGNENPIRTLGDYSKPSHEGYRNTIELPAGNNVVPLRSDTIRLVQNGCSFHGLRPEDPNQYLKDFLKLIDSLDLDAVAITTWEDLITRFLAQFFPPGRTAKLRNDILMFQQHHGESLSEAWTRKVREEIRIEQNKTKKIKKITRYPDTEDLEPLNDHKFSKTLTKEVPSHRPKIVSPKSLYVKHVRTVFPSPPLVRESTFGFKSGTKNNRNVKSQHDVANPSLQSTPQVLSSVEECTPPMTYLEEVEETFGTPIEVEPLDETQLEDLGLNTYNHDIPLSYREVPIFDEPKPQPQPLLNSSSLDVSLGDVIGPEPPIKPHSLDSSRMKVVDYLTTHIPPSPHMAYFHPKDTYCYYHPCIGNPKKHYGFKPGLLGHSGSLGVDVSKLEMIEDDWELEFKEVSFLGRILNSPVRPKEIKKVRIKETHHLEHIIQQPISQRMAPSYHDDRKAYLLEDKQIPSVGVFDEVHLEDLHVTWAHLEKKRTRLRTNTKTLEDLCSQSLETASQAIHDAVTTHKVMASQHFETASAHTDSHADLEDSTHDGIDRAAGGKLRNKNTDASWEIIKNLALYDHEGWDEPNEFVKPVKAIAIPHGIPKIPDQRC